MVEGDESMVNKVLEYAGLSKLPDATSIPQRTDTHDAVSHDVTQFDDLSAAHDPSYSQEQQDLQLQYHPAMPITGTPTAMAPAGFDDAMSFGDWSNGYWDDSTTPDWLWAGMLAPDITENWNETQLATTDNGGHTSNQDDDEADPDIVNLVAARFGSLQLAPDGRLRYFGTPANAHVLNSNRNWGMLSIQKSIKQDSARLLRNAELDKHVEPSFEEHLIKTYFSWHNSCHPVVDEAMYWSARKQRGDSEEHSGFCSDVLTNAMYVSLLSSCKY